MPIHRAFKALLVFVLPVSCVSQAEQPSYVQWEVPCSVRALEVASDETVWYAGSEGCVGQFKDSQWETLQVLEMGAENDSTRLAFRSLASAAEGSPVYALGIGSPALLYRLEAGLEMGVVADASGLSAALVHRVDDSSAFFDAMISLGERRFIAMGDPIDSVGGGCLAVLRSEDDGATWSRVPCENLPEVLPGEAAFAASNSNLASAGDTVWMVSGGGASRVFRSLDAGLHWSVFDTPLLQGGQMTGAFTMAFANSKVGVIWGGNWEEKAMNKGRAAVTHDGGESWSLLAEGTGPGYLSCVQHRPGSGGRQWIGVGSPAGIWHSADSGSTWASLSDSSFYTCRFTPDGETIWLAGHKKIARLQLD